MPDESIVIQSITLKGSGIYRKSNLSEDEDVNLLDYFIQRRDIFHKGNFIFFGLPPGDYELFIKARGHKAFVKKCIVQVGKQDDHLFVQLTPEKEM